MGLSGGWLCQLGNDNLAEIGSLYAVHHLLVGKNSLAGYHIFHSLQHLGTGQVIGWVSDGERPAGLVTGKTK